MKTFIVGGAVRDALLGRPVADRDWVVVGETPDSMIAAGFTLVGLDFPVFLHPDTKEEHALARTERKTAPGYGGFVFHTDAGVTLEQDLWRRDLTINAMAQSTDGRIIDPHGGQRDLVSKTFRHVSEAFREDPVRILRLARFAARYPDFTVAPETFDLMRQMVTAGEVDALVSERVWQELAKGLMESKPSRMLEVLRECGALERLLPEVDRLAGVIQPPVHHPEIDTFIHLGMVLDMAARLDAPLAVRYACLCHDLGKGTTPVELLPKHHQHEIRSAKLARPMSARLKVPADCKELADVVAMEHGNVHASQSFGAGPLIRLLERCDAFRRPERFRLALLACECDARGRLGLEDRPYPQRERLSSVLDVAAGVDTAVEAARMVSLGQVGPAIGEAIHALRVRAVRISEVAQDASPAATMTAESERPRA